MTAVSPVKSVINNLRRTWTELTKEPIDHSIPCGLQGESAGAGLKLPSWEETRLYCQGTTGEPSRRESPSTKTSLPEEPESLGYHLIELSLTLQI